MMGLCVFCLSSSPVWTLKVRCWWRNTPRWWLTWSCFVPLWHYHYSSGSSLSRSVPTLVSPDSSIFALFFVLHVSRTLISVPSGFLLVQSIFVLACKIILWNEDDSGMPPFLGAWTEEHLCCCLMIFSCIKTGKPTLPSYLVHVFLLVQGRCSLCHHGDGCSLFWFPLCWRSEVLKNGVWTGLGLWEVSVCLSSYCKPKLSTTLALGVRVTHTQPWAVDNLIKGNWNWQFKKTNLSCLF